MKTIHTHVAETMQRTIETILLGDWRTLGKDQLLQGVAHVRSVKAHYVSTHMAQGLEIQEAMLVPLDQVLTTLNLLLDTLEGRDMKLQQAIYDALQNAQAPLLAAYAMVPRDEVSDVDVSFQGEAIPDDGAAQHEQNELREQNPSFRWTRDRERKLIGELQVLASQSGPMNAKFALIAERYGWPLRSVEYKAYALQRKQKQVPREGEEPASSKEDDRSAHPDERNALSQE